MNGRLTPVNPSYSAACSMMDLDAAEALAPHFDALELSVDFALDDPTQEHVSALREVADRHDIHYTVHAPFRDVNICSLNDAVYQAAKRDTVRSVELADALDARLVNLHPGIHAYFPMSRIADMKAREVEVIRAACEQAEAKGILVTIENLIDTNSHFEDTWTLDGLFETVAAVDHPLLGYCLDTGHAHQAGVDVATAVSRLAAGPSRRLRSLVHLHAHDNHGGPIDEHLPVGDGTIDWPAVARALQEAGFAGDVVFETFDLSAKLASRDALSRLV